MRPDDVAARVELANLFGGEEPALADEIGGDEAVATPSHRLEPVGDDGVIGQPAVVERELRLDIPQPVELRLERGYRQLVAIGRGRAEAALAGVRRVDVMKEQGYDSHLVSGARSTSSGDTR